MTDKLRPFTHFGVDLAEPDASHQAWGTCPFCQNEKRKFAVNARNGLWDCKHCDRSGNINTFLLQYLEDWENANESNAAADWRELADDRRGIPWQLFRDHRFTFDYDLEAWIYPVFNSKGTVVNLRQYRYGQHPIATAGLPHSIYRFDQVRYGEPIFICEGEWDALALEALRRKTRNRGSVIAVPGSAVFKKEWVDLLPDHADVYLLYDNDEAGEKGMRKVCDLLDGHVRSLHVIDWPAETPEGMDIRDYCAERQSEPVNAFNDLLRSCKTYASSPEQGEPETIDFTPRDTIDEVLTDFRSRYKHFDQDYEDAFRLMCAIIFSVQIPGDPLWMYIIGPPGCGKTLVARTFQHCPYTIFRSSVTSKSLVSGFLPPGADPNEAMNPANDPSLIPKLSHKTLVMKDYTETIIQPEQELREISAIWRGAFDGFCQKTFGNGLHREYKDCHFNIIACVTDIIYTVHDAHLGERFLKYRFIQSKEFDAKHSMRSALDSMPEQLEIENYMAAVVGRYTDRTIAKEQIPPIPDWMLDRCMALACLVGGSRANVTLHRADKEPAYRHSPEVGTRLVKQLAKLAQALAIVEGQTEITEETYRLIEKVAVNSGEGWSWEVLETLYHLSDDYHTKAEIIENAGEIPAKRFERRLSEMVHLGMVERRRIKTQGERTIKTASNKRGAPPYKYRLTQRYIDYWNTAFPEKSK